MREIRQYGSEGGAAGQPAVPTPIRVLPREGMKTTLPLGMQG